MKVLPKALCTIKPDDHTVVLYDWQGPNGRLMPDVMGDKELTLTWTNMGGDKRVSWPGREGRFPQDTGHGEHGWVTSVKGNPKLDLKTCDKEWTVEAWVRRGGPFQAFGEGDQPFHFGHICGSYDTTARGVWELYLSDIKSPDGSMAPGIHFCGAQPDQALMDLHPWHRPQGIVGDPADAAIRDTQWHHVAWQYSYAEDLHQLFLDGKLIWQMKSPDGRKLVNDRQHELPVQRQHPPERLGQIGRQLQLSRLWQLLRSNRRDPDLEHPAIPRWNMNLKFIENFFDKHLGKKKQ